MTKTTTDLAIAVLRHLSVIDASENANDADAEDIAYIQDLYDSKFHELADEELTYWAPDEVPEPLFLAIRDLVANEARGTYGEPILPSEKEAQEIVIKKRIRRNMHLRSSGKTVKGEYF